MKFFSVFILLALFIGCERELIVNNVEEKSIPGMGLRGRISGTLTIAGSPYRIFEDIYVDSLNTLLIEPGVRMEFDERTKLIIKGNLIVNGNQTHSVIFTAKDTSWGGIKIYNSPKAELYFSLVENVDSEMIDSANGAIEVINSALIVKNCRIENNRSMNGGGIFLSSSLAEITNNIFLQNFSIIFGGAILSENSNAEIINNTFAENRSANFGGGIILGQEGKNIIINNIFYKNSGRTGHPGIDIYGNNPSVVDSSYNFFFHNTEPRFFSESDFHLQIGSPLKDKGNPASEFNDADGSRNDPGAYGGPSGNW